MQKIAWSDDLKLGIKFIDNHHRKLIGVANEFINAANQRSTAQTLTRLLRKIREHAVAQIKIEERIMAAVRYRRRAMHSLENQRFKIAMQQFCRRLDFAGEVTTQDIQQLKGALLSHIQDSNKAITQSMVQTPVPSGWRGVSQKVSATH